MDLFYCLFKYNHFLLVVVSDSIIFIEFVSSIRGFTEIILLKDWLLKRAAAWSLAQEV